MGTSSDTKFQRAVDRAITANNAAYLAQGPARIQADAEHHRDVTLWQLALRHGFGLGPQMDAHIETLCGEIREATAQMKRERMLEWLHHG